ncbi:hypothetical protein FQA39_LY15423 [Lamprigera yunnana]|nr:hypothetical protein FQA39_LY15423 [Lamprigera yunnana]
MLRGTTLLARNLVKNVVRSHHGGVPGENLPFDLGNKYKLTLLFSLFVASGFGIPFLIRYFKMASQTHGIQQLLAAEKKAAEKVSEARKRKTRRIKQARDEAQAEIEKYRKERERQYKEFEVKHLGSREDVAARIDKNTQCHFHQIAADVVNNKEKCQFLQTLDGKDIQDTIRRVLSCIMSNNLTMLYNWSGRNDKTLFSALKNILKLLIVAVRKNPFSKKAMQQEIESVVKVWLRNASD